jgi:hypothetical protein
VGSRQFGPVSGRRGRRDLMTRIRETVERITIEERKSSTDGLFNKPGPGKGRIKGGTFFLFPNFLTQVSRESKVHFKRASFLSFPGNHHRQSRKLVSFSIPVMSEFGVLSPSMVLLPFDQENIC